MKAALSLISTTDPDKMLKDMRSLYEKITGKKLTAAEMTDVCRLWRWEMKLAIIFIVLVLTVPAMAQTTTVTRDSMGRLQFSTTRTRDGTVIRDWAGRERGTVTRVPNPQR